MHDVLRICPHCNHGSREAKKAAVWVHGFGFIKKDVLFPDVFEVSNLNCNHLVLEISKLNQLYLTLDRK